MKIKNILVYYRNRAGLTQEQLSERSGVSLSTIVRMERDECHIHNAKGTTLKKIADTLNVKVEHFFD